MGTTVGLTAVLLAAAALLYLFVRAGLLDQFDRSLDDKARLLASTVEAEFDEIDLPFDELDMREFEDADGPGYLQLWLADGSVLFRSLSLGAADLAPIARPIESPAHRWVRLPKGRHGRAVGVIFRPWFHYEDETEQNEPNGPGDTQPATITLVLARDTATIDFTLRRLKTLLASGGCATIAVCFGVMWWVIRRSLHPLDEVATEISRIGETDLAERIVMPQAPREIQPVTERLNDLLSRLEAAFHRERSFSASVAHELRTPLAALRTTMEVTLSRSRQTGEYEEALGDSLQITKQMQGMVENLLSLGRLESGQVEVAPEPVSPREMILDLWKRFAGDAEAKRLQVQWALSPEAVAITDPSLLELAIRNLLENAVAYADEIGAVNIKVAMSGDELVIRIRNSGSMLSQDEAEHVFERFWRGDTARSAAGVHCGLGLSLVKKIVEILGGAVEVRASRGGDFEIAVSIPRGDAR